MSYIYFLLTFFISYSVFSQKLEGRDSLYVKNGLNKLPSFTINGDNYFITGSSIEGQPKAENSDTKIQIGFKQRLTDSELPWNTYLFFTYKQKAFWDTYKKSLPFRETNYNPGISVIKPFFKNGMLEEFLIFQFEHESNGRDLEYSRSWNYVSIRYIKYLSDKFTASIKFWLPVGSLDDNPNIIKYRGNQQIDMAFKLNENIFFDSEIRKTYSFDLKGSLLLGLNLRLSKKTNQYLYLQYYLGYSESLIDYDKHTQKIRIGIAFKDLFLKFRK
ncbi:phospholipase A [Flavobacterium sp. NRK F10]|uniref:phospholipase A n=1 Tax=Flavobacterium sp. NRK F10 TaxID=2954931 RepID=UPI0020902DE2|nr:phospholipase A [Flavobacterium sp. NRK F10]MCO6175911.1 phospholipase A [Flavobacterium sp. NRK F10]